MFAASKTSAGATTPPAPTTDPYFDNVTMLLHGDGNGGGQNQTFIDSASNYPITVTGNVTQGTFSPYNDSGYSIYFGNNNYLTTTAPSLLGQNFTIEMWVYYNTFTSADANNYQNLVGVNNAYNATGNYLILTNSYNNAYAAGGMTIYHQNNQKIQLPAGTFSVGQWYHIALVRSGGTSLRLYINGTQAGSATILSGDAYGVSGTGLVIGSQNGFTGRTLNGYLSNVKITNNVALYTSNFTPSQTPLNTNANTTLLACASNSYESLAGSGWTFTRNGSPVVSQFSPYKNYTKQPNSYSVAFPGSNSQLTSNYAPNLTGDFTIECWVFQTVQNTFEMICGSGPNYWAIGATNNFELGMGPTGSVVYPTFTSGSAFPLNKWVHVAICRSGTSLRGFIDGVQIGSTVTNSSAFFPSGNLSVAWQGQANNWWYHGSISNFRVCTSALYTANFTPPTSQLTAIATCTFLTCQSYIFADTSANAYTITSTGPQQPVRSNPFGYTSTATTGYSTLTNAGSAYFDGATGGLNFKDYFGQNGYNFAGNFQAEAWVYPTANDASGYSEVFSSISQNTQLYYNASTGAVGLVINATVVIAATGTEVKIGMWNHIMWNRTGSTCRIFVNGKFVVSGTSSASMNISSLGYYAFSGPGYEINGYATGFLLYDYNPSSLGPTITQAFQPLTTVPPSYATGQVFNLKMANGQIIDNAQQNDLLTVGNAQVNTSIKKYGTGSIAFDGSGDALDFKPSVLDAFSQKGKWTIECWLYPTNLSVSTYIYSQVTTNFLQFSTNSNGYFIIDRSGVGNAIVSTNPLTLNTWQFIALVSDGTNLRLYINGTQSGNTVAVGTQVAPSNAIIRIGAYQNSGGSPTIAFYGYIDEFRITQGVARYTANFTPPTAAFPNYA